MTNNDTLTALTLTLAVFATMHAGCGGPEGGALESATDGVATGSGSASDGTGAETTADSGTDATAGGTSGAETATSDGSGTDDEGNTESSGSGTETTGGRDNFCFDAEGDGVCAEGSYCCDPGNPDTPCCPTMGSIVCGEETCEAESEDCCLGDGLGPHCIPNFGSCGGPVIQCDDPGDCEGASICCVSLWDNGDLGTTFCSAPAECADAGEYSACLVPDECPDGDMCCPLDFGGGYCSPACG